MVTNIRQVLCGLVTVFDELPSQTTSESLEPEENYRYEIIFCSYCLCLTVTICVFYCTFFNCDVI